MKNISEDTLDRYRTSAEYHKKMAEKVEEFWPEGSKNPQLKAAHEMVARGMAELYAILGVYRTGRYIDEIQSKAQELASLIGFDPSDIGGGDAA